jgi:hypothetical protein
LAEKLFELNSGPKEGRESTDSPDSGFHSAGLLWWEWTEILAEVRHRHVCPASGLFISEWTHQLRLLLANTAVAGI